MNEILELSVIKREIIDEINKMKGIEEDMTSKLSG